MKKILLFLLISLINLVAISQEVSKKNNFNLHFGYGFIYNDLNNDSYFWYKYPDYDKFDMLQNYTLKVEIPTKLKYLDLIFGASFANDLLYYADGDGCVQGAYGRGNQFMNGGSIFTGVSPKLKFKNFGLTSEIRIGYFTYREHLSFYDTVYEKVDVHERIESSGLGAQINAGFYLKLWRIGVNPQANFILSADADASYIFYGFEIPLVLYF